MTSTRSRPWVPWLALAVIVLGVANFLVFIVESSAAGGDAFITRIHGIVTFASSPFVVLAMAFLVIRYVLPTFTAGNAPGSASERVMAIRASGVLLWQGWPGGVIGGANATVGMLGAAVYPGGIVVTPRFAEPSAIRTDEIRSVRFGRRVVRRTIEVEHAGIDLVSPVQLYGSQGSPQAAAILSLVSAARHDLA